MFLVNFYDKGVKECETIADVLWEIRNDDLEQIKSIIDGDNDKVLADEDFIERYMR